MTSKRIESLFGVLCLTGLLAVAPEAAASLSSVTQTALLLFVHGSSSYFASFVRCSEHK